MPRKIETVATEVAANEVTTLRATGAGSGDILTADGSGGSAWAAPAGGGGAGVYASVTTLTNGQSITSAHSGGLVMVDSAAESTLTLANDSAGGWAAGAVLDVMSLGSGRVIIAQGSGVTIAGSATASPIIYRGNQRVTLIRVGADAWVAVGSSTMMALGYNGVVQALYPLDGNFDDYTGGSAMTPIATTWELDSVVAGGKSVTGTPGGLCYCSFIPPENTIEGTADWTVEGWFKCKSSSTSDHFLVDLNQNANFTLRKNAGTNEVILNLGSNNTAALGQTPVGSISVGQWFHIAIVRDAGAVRVYMDGGLTYDSGFLSGDVQIYSTMTLGHGVGGYGLGEFYADQLRVSNVALYTDNFVPAAQLVAL